MKSPLDPSVIWIAFLAVVMAEIGCFCRTAAIVVRYGSPWSVCIGTILGNALLLIPLFIGGEWLHRVIPSNVARIVGGLVLIIMGVVALLSHEH